MLTIIMHIMEPHWNFPFSFVQGATEASYARVRHRRRLWNAPSTFTLAVTAAISVVAAKRPICVRVYVCMCMCMCV